MDYSAYKCVCGGTEPVEAWRGTLYKCDPDYEFALLACANCGLGMLWPPLTEQEKARVSGRTHTGRLHRPGSGRRFSIAHVRDASKGLLCRLVASELPAGASVLDVGCGSGDLAIALAQKGFQVTGLDPAPAPADKVADYGVTVEQSTFEDFEPGRRRFDGIILSHVLEHLPDPGLALRQARELMAPSARLFIELPNLNRPAASVRRLCSVQHPWYFTPDSLRYHLAAARLRPLFERTFRLDCFQLIAARSAEAASPPPPDPGAARRTAAIIRRHRWLYYARLQFIWRKIPYLRRAIYFLLPRVRRAPGA